MGTGALYAEPLGQPGIAVHPFLAGGCARTDADLDVLSGQRLAAFAVRRQAAEVAALVMRTSSMALSVNAGLPFASPIASMGWARSFGGARSPGCITPCLVECRTLRLRDHA
jgi:hypothetical protein